MSKTTVALLIFLFIITCNACKIKVMIRSQTNQKFGIQIFVPSVKQKTERILFTGKKEKIVQVRYKFFNFNWSS